VPKTHWFKVFELLEGIVKRTEPARLEKIAAKLRNAVLKQDRDLINAISPQWHYMTMAFSDCRGKKVRPADLPYRIMGRFVDHYEKHSLT
jgi:hypothetical protein